MRNTVSAKQRYSHKNKVATEVKDNSRVNNVYSPFSQKPAAKTTKIDSRSIQQKIQDNVSVQSFDINIKS